MELPGAVGPRLHEVLLNCEAGRRSSSATLARLGRVTVGSALVEHFHAGYIGTKRSLPLLSNSIICVPPREQQKPMHWHAS